MKILYALFISLISLTAFSCSKGDDFDSIQKEEIKTGIYTGFLGNIPYGISILDFKIEVSKISAGKYAVRQITNSSLPTFYLTMNTAITEEDILLEKGGYYKATIPYQTSGNEIVKGDGNGEEDAGFYAPQKRLTFSIQINNAGYRVAFSGIKE